MSKSAGSPAIVTCEGQTKIYQTGVVALNDLTLSIEPGMSFGLMGENGAGKSTLVRLLIGFIFPTRGQLSILGETEVRRAHTRIGYLHEHPYVELRFTARRYLTYMAQLSGLWDAMNRQRVQDVLERVDLSAAADERLSTYSKGMLQRILFLVWIAVVLFSISLIFQLPDAVINVLGIVRAPLWPIAACYNVSITGTLGLPGLLGLLLEGVYVVGFALVAGYWLERRELLLY